MRARDTEASGIYRLLTRYVSIEPDEVVAVLWSALYFFSLLCGYYILRPMREEMGIAGGIENLDWMFTGTFVAMLAAVPLFGWAAARYRRSRLLPAVYTFFIANIIGFYALFVSDITHAYVARAFFIWVSVFNLFVVSVFWSFMTDVYSNQQARRLFGFIAAGGTLGALAGPALTAALVGRLGTANLLLLSAAFLAIALLCISRVLRWVRLRPVSVEGDGDIGTDNTESDNALGGNIFAGIPLVIRSPYLLGICALILLYTTLATFLYFQQAEIVRDSFADPATRTSVFAGMDFATNLLTVLAQVFLTARIVRRFGIAVTLALIPVGLAAGFLILSFAPVLSVLVVLQVLRRAGNFSIMKPAREMLYVVLGREEKYKAKNFIDTVVYRGGDAVSAWAYSGLQALGLTLSAIAFLAVPLAALWAMISYRLGSE
ncbi:MAG: MFS transporter, partial [Rhodothermales bacterium]|nr:MFS transporter [Rhodothermales bacterium]